VGLVWWAYLVGVFGGCGTGRLGMELAVEIWDPRSSSEEMGGCGNG
jgi:hypothetical protein